MAYVVASEIESRGSVMSDQLKYSSGIYYILTSGDRYYDRCKTIEDEVANSPLRTTNKEKALAYWDEFTAHHWSRDN